MFIIIFSVYIIIKANVESRQPKLYNVSAELSKIDQMDGLAFENWCAKLFRDMGFKNVQTTKASGDYGDRFFSLHCLMNELYASGIFLRLISSTCFSWILFI
uniref:Restriction endonuclease type IV Mrr domain-containing protein n=1 Tax=uncultured bacterium Contig1771_n_1784_cl TaxID=1393511 RepID=W0FN64_9BACT|nr:hypothetical protein [uncultured bacterium Contig1771_n_1784_cl]